MEQLLSRSSRSYRIDMATVRIPESAEPLLRFCRTSGEIGPHVWETYADMITFLAAYAYGRGEIPTLKPKFGKSANAIDLAVFRSRGVYPALLTLSLSDTRNWLVAKAADEIAAIAERYADAGARLLNLEIGNGGVERISERLLSDLGTGVARSRPTPTSQI
jgi:hypothetical protein